MRAPAWLLLVFVVSGCASESGTPRRDAGFARDAGPGDGGDLTPDAAAADAFRVDAPGPDASVGSRCAVTPRTVLCVHETRVILVGATLAPRAVHFQVPFGPPPEGGFPVVLAFQGATLSTERSWAGDLDDPTDLYGGYYQALVLANLLDAGYAVIAPEAALDGSTYYDTNIPPYATFWETAPDHQLMLEIFAGIEGGDFGPLDPSSMFAAGFSSGGYMTSRMAVSYPGRFRSLAIQSASYATCTGAACLVPSALPADHPPTLFLHGELDAVVPVLTMYPYEEALRTDGVATRLVTDPLAGHGWIAAAPDEVLAWFEMSR